MGRKRSVRCVPLTVALVLSPVLALRADSLQAGGNDNQGTFYTRPALFSYRPSDTLRVVSTDRFGPVGVGIEFYQPALVMKIKNIEEGSPAKATGELRAGQ